MRRSTHCADVHSHTHTQNNATPSPPQIILSNISLTPAVREHFPRVRSYNQTTEGDQSTRKTKLTKRSLSLSLSCSPAFPLFLLPLETKGAVPSAGHLGKCISFFIYITTRGHMIVLFFFSTGHADCVFSFSVISTLSYTFVLLSLHFNTCWNNTVTQPRPIWWSLLWKRIMDEFLMF